MARSKGRCGRPWLRARQALRRPGVLCSLCGKAIDLDLAYPHPHSFSVDHVVPLSAHGAELDMRNLRAAHLVCNKRKGKRVYPRDAGTRRGSREW